MTMQYIGTISYYTIVPYTRIFTSVFRYMIGFKNIPVRPKETSLFQTFRIALKLTEHQLLGIVKTHIRFWLTRYPAFMGLTYLGHQILQTEEVVPTIMFSSFGYLIFFGKNSMARALKYPVGAFITGFSGILFTEIAYGTHSSWTIFNPGLVVWPESITNKIIEKERINYKDRYELAKEDVMEKVKSFKESVSRNIKEKFNRDYIKKTIVETKENAVDFYYGLLGNKFIEAPQDYDNTMREIEIVRKYKEDHKDDEFTFTDNVGNKDYYQPRVTQSIIAAISGIRAAGRAVINPQLPESLSNAITKINEFRLNDPRFQKKDLEVAMKKTEEDSNVIIKGSSYILKGYKEEAKSKSFSFSSLTDSLKSFIKRKDE